MYLIKTHRNLPQNFHFVLVSSINDQFVTTLLEATLKLLFVNLLRIDLKLVLPCHRCHIYWT